MFTNTPPHCLLMHVTPTTTHTFTSVSQHNWTPPQTHHHTTNLSTIWLVFCSAPCLLCAVKSPFSLSTHSSTFTSSLHNAPQSQHTQYQSFPGYNNNNYRPAHSEHTVRLNNTMWKTSNITSWPTNHSQAPTTTTTPVVYIPPDPSIAITLILSITNACHLQQHLHSVYTNYSGVWPCSEVTGTPIDIISLFSTPSRVVFLITFYYAW